MPYGPERMRFFKRLSILFAIFFLLPSLASAAWWMSVDRPGSWRQADWTSSGVLPPAESLDEPVIHVMAARTGGLKGALSVHSWIVTFDPAEGRYNRYDKVGWGQPVRRNAYAADARWYSNAPFFVKTVRGADAARIARLRGTTGHAGVGDGDRIEFIGALRKISLFSTLRDKHAYATAARPAAEQSHLTQWALASPIACSCFKRRVLDCGFRRPKHGEEVIQEGFM